MNILQIDTLCEAKMLSLVHVLTHKSYVFTDAGLNAMSRSYFPSSPLYFPVSSKVLMHTFSFTFIAQTVTFEKFNTKNNLF